MTFGRLHQCFATYTSKGGCDRIKKCAPIRVFVTEHIYTVDGRLSNWVRFISVKSKRKGGDYDRSDNFTDVVKAKSEKIFTDSDGMSVTIRG